MTSVHIYHCLCTELCLATSKALSSLPQRSHDKAFILKLDGSTASELGAAELLSAIVEPQPLVLRMHDGFEKRYMVKCGRCGIAVAYQLDQSQFEDGAQSGGRREDVLFVLPGGLMTTQEMEAGKDMGEEVEMVVGVAG